MGGKKTITSFSTVYEPDKVKVAEINAQKEVVLKQMEGNNIKLRKEATIELIETNARFEQLIINAQIDGAKEVATLLKEMTKEFNLLAQQRILILESASNKVITEINQNYLDFKRQIEKDANNFMKNDLYELLKQANEFEIDSPAFIIYHEQIRNFSKDFLISQKAFISQNLVHQNQILQSHLELKKNIIEHTSNLVENRIKYMEISINRETQKLLQNSLQTEQNNKSNPIMVENNPI